MANSYRVGTCMGLRNCELLHTTADLVRKEAKGTRTARLPIPNPSFLYTERGQPLTRTVKRYCIYRALMTFQNTPFCGRAHVKDDNKRVKGTDCEALRGLMECSLWESTHYFLERGGRVQHDHAVHRPAAERRAEVRVTDQSIRSGERSGGTFCQSVVRRERSDEEKKLRDDEDESRRRRRRKGRRGVQSARGGGRRLIDRLDRVVVVVVRGVKVLLLLLLFERRRRRRRRMVFLSHIFRCC